MSNFTPGPWVVRQRAGKPFITHGKCTKKESIALIQSDNILDAQLIAAAPELYEALKEFLECGKNAGNNQELLAMTRKAIAKAEGK